MTAIFFVPATDESVEQRDGGNGVRCRRPDNIRAGLAGGDSRNRQPMSAGRELFCCKVHVTMNVHAERVAVPEIGDVLLFPRHLRDSLINVMGHLVKFTSLFSAEGDRWRRSELCRAIKSNCPDKLPMRFNGRHIRRRGWNPFSLLPCEAVTPEFSGVRVLIAGCPLEHFI